MTAFLPLLLLAGGLVVVLACLAWLARYVRRRGAAGAGIGAAMAAYDEAFRVTAHESHHEIRAQAERKAPLLSPDDHWRPGDGPAGRPGAGRRRPLPAPRRGRGGLRRLARRVRRGR
ncbi:hypothetical protein [Streptomyces lydicus]|uniref:hypothetical protein n=2 Tax=Streptomyces lydicus TaxID=47763 RepID=UPI000525473F|nr:hypothetical protein [Streptomyces lydicus]UEG94275.1 hypothetical protein LJ741_29285 [Streptomyces lydicus]